MPHTLPSQCDESCVGCLRPRQSKSPNQESRKSGKIFWENAKHMSIKPGSRPAIHLSVATGFLSSYLPDSFIC